MADVEGLRDDPGRATGWATQLQTPAQHPLDLFKVYFQGCTYLTLKKRNSHAATRRRNARRAVAPPREKLFYGSNPLTTR